MEEALTQPREVGVRLRHSAKVGRVQKVKTTIGGN